jgi:uncharacterized protein YbjT (DUF2867 family)
LEDHGSLLVGPRGTGADLTVGFSEGDRMLRDILGIQLCGFKIGELVIRWSGRVAPRHIPFRLSEAKGMFRAGRKLAALKQCGPCALHIPGRGGSRTAPPHGKSWRGATRPDPLIPCNPENGIRDEIKKERFNMADVLIAGATGLIGGTVLTLIANDPAYREVLAVTRRSIHVDALNIRQCIVDFGNLEAFGNELVATTAICALGTTIRKAGTKENFRYVDYQLPLNLAKSVLHNNCQQFILVSAVGADPQSGVFYNHIKGSLEAEIKNLPFRSIHILRPSLLLGERNEFRFAEVLAKHCLTPIRKFIPAKYRPIQATEVARRILDILSTTTKTYGVHIYEGDTLFGL